MSKTKTFNEDDIMAMALAEVSGALEEIDEFEDETALDQEISQKDKNTKARDTKSVTCKICGEKQTWYSFGSFPNGTKKWQDEAGLICNGRMCATCNQDRARGTMRRIRGKRVGEIDS